MATTMNKIIDAASGRCFIETVRADNVAFYASSRGHGALRDLQQTFPHPWLYVGELLQNAVDAGATRIRITPTESGTGLVFEHNGGAFTPEDVEGLCTRGMSRKGAGTVGFMGIGFKAVFRSFERVDVSSGLWRFRLVVKETLGEFGDRQRDWLGCALPECDETISPPADGMTCRFGLEDRLGRLGSLHDDVERVLSSDLVVLALLAQRGVEEFSWNGQHWLLSKQAVRVDGCTERVTLDALDEGTGAVRQWVLFSVSYQPSRDAIGRFLEHRQLQPSPEEREKVYQDAQRVRMVDVFCPLDEDGVPRPSQQSEAYALLATGVSVPLGLHVQADWLLNTSRRELMDVEENPWHQEILARLPGLLRSYLSWTITIPGLTDERLAKAFAVLPNWPLVEGALSAYLSGEEFKDALRSSLADLAFLPVRTGDGVLFLEPECARLLPSALRGFDTPAMLPWLLFGDDIISVSLLGNHLLSALEHLGLVQPLSPEDLVALWEAGVVGTWREQLGTNGQDAHLRLLRALASLDETPLWCDAKLRCLPATDGGWIDRSSATGVPAEWDAVPEQDPALRSLLEPYLAPREQRLDWNFDRSLRRDTQAQQYLSELRRDELKDILRLWWDGLSDHPDDATQTVVLDVTCWVFLKQKQRADLVMRVLCENGALGPVDGVVLADPYATAARRCFFPGHPVVSGRYLRHKPGFSDADWRSFFEAASKEINGPLRLWRTAAELSRTALRERLPDYDPPATKSWAINTKYGPWSLYSKNYLIIDVILPAELAAALNSPTREVAQDIGAWLHEARQVFSGNDQLRIAYVPYNSSSVWDPKLPYPANWVGVLQSSAWVCSVGGGGPYAPPNVLAQVDPARPDAPVADLSSELVTILQGCGVEFGSNIPEVASIERLRREGLTATSERLLELLEAAIADSEGNEGYRAELNTVLDSPLILVPESATLIDGSARIGAARLVQRGARGAELGGWLLSIDSATNELGDDEPYARLLALVGSLREIPDSPNWEQALTFLQWVWHARPNAELVRHTLPRAYRLITEAVEGNAKHEEAWSKAKQQAMVYARKWVGVTRDDVFLDDLGDERLKGMVGTLLLATPGHLGETLEEQYRAASLLGIRRLSSRFQIALKLEGEQALPSEWTGALDGILKLLESYAQEDDADGAPTTRPAVSYCARITKSLVDEGVATNHWTVQAARDAERICVAGDPDDFAADLCRVLLQWAGLSNRRDLDELAPTLTQLIGWLDRPEKFSPRLETLRSQRGIQASSPSTDAPGAPADQPTPLSTKRTATAPGPAPSPALAPSGGALSVPGEPGVEATGDQAQPAMGDVGVVPPAASSGHTADDRERRLQAVRKRQAELDAQEKALLGVGPLPAVDTPDDGEERSGEFRSDDAYRDAVLVYEQRAGRFPVAKPAAQKGHDIDSYDKPLADSACRLVRRIEVKGHGCTWADDETVEMSDRQFLDAIARKVDQTAIDNDFDYWLYVVERTDHGMLNVIPIKNPAQRAAKFEFRGGTWRALAEPGDSASAKEAESDSEE